MAAILLRLIFLFIGLVLFQVLVVDNINIQGGITPLPYIFFVLAMPFFLPPWMILLGAFFMGITIDLFHYSPGINASATVFAGFLRTFYFNYFPPPDEPEEGHAPHLYFIGFSRFMLYLVIMVLLHHIFLFSVQSFGNLPWSTVFYRALLSGVGTIFIILITDLLLFYKSKN